MVSSTASSTASTSEVVKPTQEQITKEKVRLEDAPKIIRTHVRNQYHGEIFQDRLVSDGKVAPSLWDNIPAMFGGTNQDDAQKALDKEIDKQTSILTLDMLKEWALSVREVQNKVDTRLAATKAKSAAAKEANNPPILVTIFMVVFIIVPIKFFGALFNGVKSMLGFAKSVVMRPFNKLTSSSEEVSDKTDSGASAEAGSATAKLTEGNAAE